MLFFPALKECVSQDPYVILRGLVGIEGKQNSVSNDLIFKSVLTPSMTGDVGSPYILVTLS